MGHQDRSTRMFVVRVKLLDNHDLGAILLNHFYYTFVYRMEARRQIGCMVVSGPHNAGFADARTLGRHFEDAVAGNAQTGINAEYAAGR